MPTADSAPADLRDTRTWVGPPPEAVRLPLDSVEPNPDNPRHNLPEIDDLAANIRRYGLMQPITVRSLSGAGEDERYQVIAGHRRRLAFIKLREQTPHEPQWRTIAAVIRSADDETAYLMLLSSQLHTRSFTPHEEATALERFGALGWTQDRVGEVLNRSVPWVSKRMRVYQDSVLSGPVQARQLAPGVADELIGVPSVERRRELAERAIEEQWSQDEVRARIREQTPTKQVQHVIRLIREAMPLLKGIHPDDLSPNQQKELWAFRDEITRLAQRPKRGEKRVVVMPTIEQAQRAAGQSTNPRSRRENPRARRQPGLKLPEVR